MLPGGETQQVRFPQLANTICSNPVWNPGNGELLFTASNGASLNWLWSAKVDTDGRSTSLRLIGNLGDGAKMLAISPTGNHLAFTKHISSETLRLVDLAEGSSGAWQTVLASTYRKSWPRFSPDGKRIAFESDRAGFMDVWLANADGSGAFALTNFNGPVTGSPAWSPDGRQIAFDSRASGEPQVYTIRAEKGAQPKRITTGNGNFLPAWSADGHFLYFVSNRTGDATVWRVPAEGGRGCPDLARLWIRSPGFAGWQIPLLLRRPVPARPDSPPRSRNSERGAADRGCHGSQHQRHTTGTLFPAAPP